MPTISEQIQKLKSNPNLTEVYWADIDFANACNTEQGRAEIKELAVCIAAHQRLKTITCRRCNLHKTTVEAMQPLFDALEHYKTPLVLEITQNHLGEAEEPLRLAFTRCLQKTPLISLDLSNNFTEKTVKYYVDFFPGFKQSTLQELFVSNNAIGYLSNEDTRYFVSNLGTSLQKLDLSINALDKNIALINILAERIIEFTHLKSLLLFGNLLAFTDDEEEEEAEKRNAQLVEFLISIVQRGRLSHLDLSTNAFSLLEPNDVIKLINQSSASEISNLWLIDNSLETLADPSLDPDQQFFPKLVDAVKNYHGTLQILRQNFSHDQDKYNLLEQIIKQKDPKLVSAMSALGVHKPPAEHSCGNGTKTAMNGDSKSSTSKCIIS